MYCPNYSANPHLSLMRNPCSPEVRPATSPIMDQLRCYLCDSMLSLGAWLDHLKTHTEELQQEGAALDQTFKTYLEAFQMAAILFEEISACSASRKTSFA